MNELNKITILIPARMESTRFPGKPLAPIGGIPMVVYCARNAIATGLQTIVCTDSREIKSVCELYNVKAIITPNCNTGTDRIALAMEQIKTEYIINLQGDEPLIDEKSLKDLINFMTILKNEKNLIIAGVSEINSEQAFDPNNVRCVLINKNSSIQYLSRKPLLNSIDKESGAPYYKQLGLYAMARQTLLNFHALDQSNLELAENIELLRWIDNEKKIKGCILGCESISVDTPEDLVKVINQIDNN